MKKKILSLVLALLMAGSSAAMVAADDVVLTAASENKTHAASAEFLQSQEIMKGKEDGNLALNDNIKRYEMALFVSRISTGWTDDKQWDNGMVNNTGYTDLEGSGAINVMGAITYADQKGIIEGYGNGEFGPEDGITYQDALTMAVRTLGYKKLGWPWEYIEKAIELGLTKDVTDKAYTAVLNRGEVAQLIYNTLNTPKRDGYTLAFEKFNMIEETIMITASDRAVFKKGDITAPAGKVAFKIYDVATGTLGQYTYYANASEFAFEGHEDETSVGYIYKALLNTDKEGNITTAADGSIIKGYEATTKVEEENLNGTNNIVAALKNVKIASKNFRAKADETLVYSAHTTVGDITVDGLAMDWVTGDILKEVFENQGYTHVSADGKFYQIAYYYNATMNEYFTYKLNSTGGIIGIEWVSKEEGENGEKSDLQKAIDALRAGYTETRSYGFVHLEKLTTAQQSTAYAELELQKFEENAAYLMGVYEEFGLGYVEKVAKAKCGACNKDYAGYKIYNVESRMAVNTEGEILRVEQEGTYINFDDPAVVVAACDTHGAWLSELEVKADEAFVIYGYNGATGELKVVKELEKQYGVLRAYSVMNPKVLIGTETIELGYDNLKGSGFVQVTKNRDQYVDGLDRLLNKYVEYVVCDGKVVSIRAAERDLGADKYLVMEEFVGMTEDGAIVVEAYSTTTGELARYRVNSYNGFYANTFYYYASIDALKAQFASGNLYYVTNYVTSNTVDMELVGWYDENGDYVVDTNKIVLEDQSVEFTIDGYKILNGKEDKLLANEGKYIVISPKQEIGRAPIYFYEGEVFDTSWYIEGQILKNVPGVSVFVAIDKYEEGELAGELKMNGFALDAHKHGMYMYDGGKIREAAYDKDAFETFFGVDESLILPTDKYYVVELLNLYTGEIETRALRNLIREDIVNNTIYVTIGDNVEYIYREAFADGSVYDFVGAMSEVFYQDKYVDKWSRDARTSADYVFGTIENYTIRDASGVDLQTLTNELKDDLDLEEDRNIKIDASAKKKVPQYAVTYLENGAIDLAPVDTFVGKDVVITYVYEIKDNSMVVYVELASVLAEDEVAGEEQTITAMPDVNELTEAAEVAAPESTELSAWIVNGEKVAAEEIESYLAAIYAEEPAAEIVIQPVYTVVEAPETTAPETTAPETTAPETTAPETTAPETQAPETQAPETTAPETTAPETTAPETTAPETTAPETTAPETTAPETTAPETELVGIEVSVTLTAAEGTAVANSFAFAELTYDETLLVFGGFDEDVTDCPALKGMFGALGLDSSMKTVVIALNGGSEVLTGKVCDVKFTVAEGADAAAALAAAENVNFAMVKVLENSTDIAGYALEYAVTPVYAVAE